MPRPVLIIAVTFIAVFGLAKLGFFSAVIVFWLSGLIPGTNYALPSFVTLLLSMVPLAIVVIFYTPLEDFLKQQLSWSKTTWQRNLPRRRYTRLQAPSRN